MPFAHPAPFRRILLSRILVLVVPVVVGGEAMVYAKARQSLLSTSQQYLGDRVQLEAQLLGQAWQATDCSPSTPCSPSQPSSALNLPPLPPGLSRIVVASTGQILTHPDPTQLGQPAPPTLTPPAGWLAASAAIPSPRLPQGAQGRVVLWLSQAEAVRPLAELRWLFVGVTLIWVVCGLILAQKVARELTAPLEILRRYTHRVQQHLAQPGAQPLEAPLDLARFPSYELRQLAVDFDALLGRLRQYTAALELASQEAIASSRLKSEFLAATSHELRTPLNAIIGHIRLVRDGCCDDRDEEIDCLTQADQATLHLLKVLNELLDIARIEAGEFTLEPQPVLLQDLVSEVFKLHQPQLDQRGLRGELGLPERSLWVWADPGKLRQVMINLLGNAIKFTDQGVITISLQGDAVPPQGFSPPEDPEQRPWVSLTICDSGIGIAPEMQTGLFKPFVRGLCQGDREGTGLGLAIARGLVERMGGQIRLHSEGLGHGTRVAVWLPLIQSDSQAPSELVPLLNRQLGANALEES